MTAYDDHRAVIHGDLDKHLPHYMVDGFLEYVCTGRLPGDFLLAVLENNLVESVGRADHINMIHFKQYALVLHNDVPRQCWGSTEIIQEWVNHGGLRGLYQKMEGQAADVAD